MACLSVPLFWPVVWRTLSERIVVPSGLALVNSLFPHPNHWSVVPEKTMSVEEIAR